MDTLWEVKLTLKYLVSKEPQDELLRKAFDAVSKKYDQVYLQKMGSHSVSSSSLNTFENNLSKIHL